MINSLWISKTGMEAQQMQLDVISNNLANVSTNGFKRASAVFEDLMYQNLRQVGANSSEQSQLPTGLQLGLGVRTVATSRSFAQGNLQQSGNKLDVAIQGNGFFQVTMPDGTTNYTRDGALQVDSQGRLVTATGLAPTARSPCKFRAARHRRQPAPSRWPTFSTRQAWSPRAKTCTPKARPQANPAAARQGPMAWAH